MNIFDLIMIIFVVTIISMSGYFFGKQAGYKEYFKGQVECKQAFEIIECRMFTK